MTLADKYIQIRRVIIFVVLFIALTGCGGGGGSSSNPPSEMPVTGKVQLPSGSALQLANMKVVTCLGEAPVAADGSCRAAEPAGGPALAFAADSSSKLVMMGFIDAEKSPRGLVIDAKSTAVALIFQALPAYTLIRDAWPGIIQMLAADKNTATLAQVVSQRLAANPYAILDKDAALLAAISTAVGAIRGSATIAASSVSKSKKSSIQSFDVQVTSKADAPAQMAVEPSGEVSGVRVGPSVDGNGITITNSFRRHLWSYVYRTGWKAKTDAVGDPPHNLNPWVCIVPGSAFSGYIQAVNGYQGTMGTILDFFTGQVAYSPVTTGIIPLPVSPSDAERTYYKVFVVGPSWKSGDLESELPAEYAGSSFGDQLVSTEQKMDALTFFQEIAFPAVLTVFPADAIGKNLGNVKMGALVEDVVKIVSSSYPQMVEQLHSHQYTSALATFFKSFDSSAIRNEVVELMIRSGLLKGGFTMTAAAYLDDLNIYVSMIDKFLAAGDIGIVTAQLLSSSRFLQWNATAVKPFIRIQNNPSSVTVGLDVSLTCYGVDGITGTKEYLWSTPGAHGHLEDSHGNKGVKFTSSDQIVKYVADDNGKDGDQDTVAVTAYLKKNNKTDELGSAEASILITDTKRDVTFIPAAPVVNTKDSIRLDISILPSLPDGTKVEYDWTSTSASGTLTGPAGEIAPFTKPYAVYKAGSVGGSDTVTVTAWRITADNKRILINTGTVKVRVGATRTARLQKVPWQIGGAWYGATGTYLIFKKVPGAKKYNITWHANGAIPPTGWNTGRYDGQVETRFGYTESYTGPAINPADSLQPDELAATIVGLTITISRSDATANDVIYYYNNNKEIEEFFMSWTGDVQAVY